LDHGRSVGASFFHPEDCPLSSSTVKVARAEISSVRREAERIETAKESLIAQGELRPGGRGIWLVEGEEEEEDHEENLEGPPRFEL